MAEFETKPDMGEDSIHVLIEVCAQKAACPRHCFTMAGKRLGNLTARFLLSISGLLWVMFYERPSLAASPGFSIMILFVFLLDTNSPCLWMFTQGILSTCLQINGVCLALDKTLIC